MKTVIEMALEGAANYIDVLGGDSKKYRQLLAHPEQEPVAWMFQHEETGRMNYVSNDGIHDPTMFLGMNPRYALVCPLYITTPQRTWVGLTEYEKSYALQDKDGITLGYEDYADAIEAKLKEKNFD